MRKSEYTKCQIEGCTKPGDCRAGGRRTFKMGYCQYHYTKLRKYGDPLYVKPTPERQQKCNIEGCERLGQTKGGVVVFRKGFCTLHYNRLYTNGDPLVAKFVMTDVGGLSKHPLYPSYKNMLARCYKPSNNRYKNYGGRGITVCERWLGNSGFANFLSDMGERPEGRTLDRKENDKEYSPDNCRWATKHQQACNMSTNSSHVGVQRPGRDSNKWLAVIMIDGKNIRLGTHERLEDAIAARKAGEKKYGIEL